MLFTAQQTAAAVQGNRLLVVMATSLDFQQPVLQYETEEIERIVIPADQTQHLQPNITYYWKLVAKNEWGQVDSPTPPRQLTIDPSLPPLTDEMLSRYGENEDGLVVSAELAGTVDPEYGALKDARHWKKADGIDGQPDESVELDGEGMLIYKLKAFPERDFSISVWCMPLRVEGGLGQIFSAWSRGMDDPLRICVRDGHLNAGIEAGTAFATKPVPITQGAWYHICVVKQQSQLALHVNGELIDTIVVPAEHHSSARDLALGGNPHFTGTSEHLACRVARLKLWARALSAEEIQALGTAQ